MAVSCAVRQGNKYNNKWSKTAILRFCMRVYIIVLFLFTVVEADFLVISVSFPMSLSEVNLHDWEGFKRFNLTLFDFTLTPLGCRNVIILYVYETHTPDLLGEIVQVWIHCDSDPVLIFVDCHFIYICLANVTLTLTQIRYSYMHVHVGGLVFIKFCVHYFIYSMTLNNVMQ